MERIEGHGPAESWGEVTDGCPQDAPLLDTLQDGQAAPAVQVVGRRGLEVHEHLSTVYGGFLGVPGPEGDLPEVWFTNGSDGVLG